MNYYTGKEVLVTGGASFIGSHLCEKLVSLGAKVTVADDFSSGRIENLSHIENRIQIRRGDLIDRAFTNEVIQGKEVVFHLAAAHGGRGYIDTHPAECSSNMILDGMVFKACQEFKVDRICFASSACVYPFQLQESERSVPLSEDMVSMERASCDNEYGWAKLMGEMALRAYHRQYGLKGVSCRIFTAYGPRENLTHAVIALIARTIAKQDPYDIWGDGTQKRNFTYVDDIVEGLVVACEKITDASAINVGSDRCFSILETCEAIWNEAGFKPKKINFDLTKPVGVHSRVADPRLGMKVLGWKAQTELNVGIRKTTEWMRDNVQKDADLYER